MKTKIGKAPPGLHDAPTLILRKKDSDAEQSAPSHRKARPDEIAREVAKFRDTTVAEKIRRKAFAALKEDKRK